MNNTDGYDGSTVTPGELNAEQIVSRFAENAGLSLADVYSNYAQYASAIQQSFTSQHRKSPTLHIAVTVFTSRHLTATSCALLSFVFVTICCFLPPANVVLVQY